MARSNRPRYRLLTAISMAVFCSMILRRHGGGVLAQGSGGDDDVDDTGGDDDDTLRPTEGPSSEEASSEYPDCPGYAGHIKDGFCDGDLNVVSCGWDGGDCCACTCGQGSDSPDQLAQPCGLAGDGYDCQDPDVPADCGATPSPAAAFGFPDCDGFIPNRQNSFCNGDLNNEECGWDGGDCCRCTCREYSGNGDGYVACGVFGYDCLDPAAPDDCGTTNPTPSPAATTDYPDCESSIYLIGNGDCDFGTNSEECGWDGGDCCTCPALSSDCLDPSDEWDCATPAPSPPTPSPASIYVDDDEIGYGCDSSGNGACDPDHNTEYCGWDGGDCCFCDCEDTPQYECGFYGYNCLDPGSICIGTSSNYEGNEGYNAGVNEGARASAGGNNVEISSSSTESSSSLPLTAVIFVCVFLLVLTCCIALAVHSCGCPGWCCIFGNKDNGTSAAAGASSQRPDMPFRVRMRPPSSAAAAAAVPPPQRVRPRPPSPEAAAPAPPPRAEGTAAATRRYSSTAARGGGIEGGPRSRPLREAVFYNVQHAPPSPALAAEAAGDWGLAAAIRTSAASARTDGVVSRAYVDELGTRHFEAGVVGAQEGTYADNDAQLGRVFYRGRGRAPSPAAAAEAAGDRALAAALRTSAAAARADGVEERGSFERGDVGALGSRHAAEAERGSPPSPAAAAEAAGDRALAAALRASAAAARADGVEGTAYTDEQSAGHLVVGAQEGKPAGEVERRWTFYGTDGTEDGEENGAMVVWEEDGGGDAARTDGEGSGALVVWEEGRGGSTPSVAEAGTGDDVAAVEVLNECAKESGAVAKGGRYTSAPSMTGTGSGDDVAGEDKGREDCVEGDAIAKGDDALAEEKKEEHGAEGIAVAKDGMGAGGESSNVKTEAEENEIDRVGAVEMGGAPENETGEETANVCAMEEDRVGEKNNGGVVEDEGGVDEPQSVCALDSRGRETTIEQGSVVDGEAAGVASAKTTADEPEANGAAADEQGTSEPPGGE